MKIGVVIGTFGSAPYIHLQMESRRRYWPEIPVLVVDDCSPEKELLKAITSHYGATLISSETRLGHTNGDLNAFAAGLKWARDNGIDYIVKLSRRFLFTAEWQQDLIKTIEATNWAETYSNTCNLYIRTECMVLNVKAWLTILDKLEKSIADTNVWTLANKNGKVVELYLYNLSLKLGRLKAWDYLTKDRWDKTEKYLWHFGRGWMPYYDLGKEWGLKYKFQLYSNVNGTEGHQF